MAKFEEITLSLSPRADLFVFKLPKDFIPDEVRQKYEERINIGKSVPVSAIDYLNESITSITFPGLTDLITEQEQHSLHRHTENAAEKHIDVDTRRNNSTYSPANILTQISNEFTVTFRKNQGFLNYFMIYESIFYKILKEYDKRKKDDFFEIIILSETGLPVCKIILYQPRINGIDGFELGYNKVERAAETFDLTFKYNNIDFELL